MKNFFLIGTALLGSCAFAQTICIDPGHPSEVGMGTRSKQISEVRAAWVVAQGLEKSLSAKGYKVILTKKSEMEKVLNQTRAEIANDANADLMIRLHCDAQGGSGFAVYYPGTTGKTKRKDGSTFVGPTSVVIAGSRDAAKKVFFGMGQVLKGSLKNNGIKTDKQTAVGKKQGALTGSIFSKVPVVLVEMCVLTNKKDAAFMASKAGQDKMVAALTRGIEAAVPRKK